MSDKVRPTKKQYELLKFIETFVVEKGYGPSYREIMAGCNYTSVATVALHVNNLIKRGQLRKKDRSARSLEVVDKSDLSEAKIQTNLVKPSEEKWLVEHIEYLFAQAENGHPSEADLDNLQILMARLKCWVWKARRIFSPGLIVKEQTRVVNTG